MTTPNERKELKLNKTLWGIEEPISPQLFHSIKREGYHGVEVIRLPWLFDRGLLVNSLNEAGLEVICQVHTLGGYLHKDNGEYIYCGAYDVAAHEEDFQKQLRECKELLGLVNNGGFIDAHAGVDAWSNEEAIQFLDFCLKEIEQIAPEISVTFLGVHFRLGICYRHHLISVKVEAERRLVPLVLCM
jgi:hypothetical protein